MKDSHEGQQSGGNSPASDFLDQPEGGNDQPETEGGDGRSSDEIGEQKSEEHGQEQEVKGEQGGETSEPEVKTVDNLEEALKDLVNRDGWENVYVESTQRSCESGWLGKCLC